MDPFLTSYHELQQPESLKIAMPDRRTRREREPPAMAEPSSNGSSTEKQTDFEFVCVVPTKDGRAKPRRQAVVRQNAAKYQWRNSKAAKTAARKSPAASASMKQEPGVKQQRDEKNVGPERRVTRPGYIPDGPRPALRMDYLSFANDDKVAKIMNFSSRELLPAIMPSSRPNVDHPGNRAFIQMITSDPLLFDIWEVHTEVHHRYKLKRPLIPECNFDDLHSRSITNLNRRLHTNGLSRHDSTIVSVLGLAMYGELIVRPRERARWPSQGPLTNLNGIDTLGRLRAFKEHINGLDDLIKWRGGMQEITTPGVAQLLSALDILEATRVLGIPKFPHIPWNEDSVMFVETLQTFERLPDSMPEIGRGFPEEWKPSDSPLLQNLFTTFRYMSSYSRLVLDHSEGIKLQSTGTLTDLRNSLQHRLLCLPARPNALGRNGIYHLYESARLGAQIYSLLCIYPYPAGPAPFAEAASRLKRELLTLDPRTITYEESKLLLWILTMGAIVTVGTLDRLWFISALGPVACRLQVESWPDMKSLLLCFLWLSKTNDIDGRDVWDEVSSSIFEHSGPVRFSSATPSVVSSLDMSIRTRSISSAEIEENPGEDQPFSTPS